MDKIQKAYDEYRARQPKGRQLIPWHVWQSAINWYKSNRARTNKQNNLYWRRLGEIADQAVVEGRKYNSYAWHIYFKMNIWDDEFKGKDGKIITKHVMLPDGKCALRSTKIMSKEAFNIYIEKIEAFAVTELGVKFSADYCEPNS